MALSRFIPSLGFVVPAYDAALLIAGVGETLTDELTDVRFQQVPIGR